MAWFWIEVSRVNWDAPGASWFPGSKERSHAERVGDGDGVQWGVRCRAQGPLSPWWARFGCCVPVQAVLWSLLGLRYCSFKMKPLYTVRAIPQCCHLRATALGCQAGCCSSIVFWVCLLVLEWNFLSNFPAPGTRWSFNLLALGSLLNLTRSWKQRRIHEDMHACCHAYSTFFPVF